LPLAFPAQSPDFFGMGMPQNPVTLNAEEVAELNKKLSTMRHDINNNLAMIMAAAELIRLKPDMAPKMIDRLLEQPTKITDQIKQFSAEFEKAFGITRP
jgi:hypothetical protein